MASPARDPGLSSETPRPAPPPCALQTPPHAGRFPAFRPAEVASCSSPATWSLFRCARPLRLSDPDLALTSGFPMCLRTDISAPNDHAGILASPVASNPNFLPTPQQPLSAASLQPLLRLASFLRPANGGPVYSAIAGSRESEAPLNGCHRQRGTPAAEAFCAFRGSPPAAV